MQKKHLALAGLLLLVEYLAVSFAFDARLVISRGGAWSVLAHAGNVGPLVVVAVTAFLLHARSTVLCRAESTPRATLRIPWLVAHAACFAIFFLVTSLAFGDQPPAGPAALWMIVWGLAGLLTAVTLLLSVVFELGRLKSLLAKVFALGGLLGLLAWLGGLLTTGLWPYLARATFITVASILDLTGMELLADSPRFILELEGFAITVAPVCSGVEGVGLFGVLMGAFLYRLRHDLRFPQALLLLPLGMAAVWLGNSLRIAALMIVGARLDPELAIGSFHSKAGWVFFCAITLGVAALGRAAFGKGSEELSGSHGSETDRNPVAPLLLPLIVWISVGMLTSAFADGHDPLYGMRVLATIVVLFAYRRTYGSMIQRPTPLAIGLGALVGLVWVLVPMLVGAENGDGAAAAQSRPPGGAGWIAVRCLGAVLLVPVVEELAFRGFLARKLSATDFLDVPYQQLTPFAILVSSLAFGALHEQWLLATVTGVAYALLLRKSGRIADCIGAHGVSNAVIAAWVLATGAYQYW